MNAKALLWYALSIICLVIAVYFFVKSLDWKIFLVLALGIASVLLFRQGINESKKKET